MLLASGTAWAQGGGPALVRIAVASMQDIAPITLVPGTVVSRSDARLSAEVPGRLTMVRTPEGRERGLELATHIV